MDQLSLYCCLGLNKPVVTAFIGGGGKTSLMHRLAGELAAHDRKVLITTTTNFYPFPGLPHFYSDSLADPGRTLSEHFKQNSIAVLGGSLTSNGKIASVSPQLPGTLARELKVHVLVEADGSKGRPLKGYESYEPVLPPDSGLIVSVIGADALGTPVDEVTVHRSELFRKALFLSDKPIIADENLLALAFNYMRKTALKQAPLARCIYTINKHDLLDNPGKAYKIACKLKATGDDTPLLSTEAKAQHPVKMYLNAPGQTEAAALSCIILAAGSSVRMGEKDKLALPFKQSTVLQSTLEQVNSSDVSEIIVVTAPGSPWKKILTGKKIKVVENVLHKSGQASSLQAGLTEVDPQAQAVIFALGDQPLIESDIFKRLIKQYRTNLKPVTYPVYQNRRGNPVIFDRRLWPLLMKLEGDEGGRAVIKNLRAEEVEIVHTDNKSIITDIDTPEDYQAVLQMNDNE
jgi:molybdenum cofactor cytidylyltransferase